VEKFKVSKAEKELLRTIINNSGGVSCLARLLGFKHRQSVENWVNAGRVPLLHLWRAADALCVHPEALNYKQFCFATSRYPNWNSVVECNAPKYEIKRILAIR